MFVQKLQKNGFSHTFQYLKQFIENSYCSQNGAEDSETKNLPTAAVLTGINQPDHYTFFKTFSDLIKQQIKSHVCIIQSRDCPTMKSTIETMVSGLMEDEHEDNEIVISIKFKIIGVNFFL